MRAEIIITGTKVLLLFVILNVLYVVQQTIIDDPKGEEDKTFVLEHALILSVPACLALATAILARFKLHMIELCAPVYLLSSSLIMLVLTLVKSDEAMTKDDYVSIIIVSLFQSTVCTLFLTSSYLPQLVVRQLLGLPL